MARSAQKQASPPAVGYRPEIDGLRAVAVIAVVLYHVGAMFPGGYTGVDIFFVISGYLITRLLLAELSGTGRIALLDFYRRRIRRLLPALTVMLLTVGAVALVILAPFGELQTFAKTLAATALNASNFFFMRRRGYFEASSEENPLLHTWTLGVEEQFYLVWPLGLVLLAKTGGNLRLRVGMGLAILTAVSFAASLWATTYQPYVAFYSMPTRAWEFGLGALLVLVRPGVGRTAAALAGMVLILCGLFLLNDRTPFPGLAAILPALGATLVIYGVSGETFLTGLLARPFMVTIGKLSYSWYLWHWPLIVFAGLLHPGGSIVRDGLAATLALGLAWLSWRFVETPLRRRKGPAIRPGLAASAVVLLLAALVAGWAALAPDVSTRAATLARATQDRASDDIRCYSDTDWRLKPADQCVIGGGAPQLLLWGDSHADHLVPLLEAVGEPTLVRNFGACAPLMEGYPYRYGRPYEACRRFNEGVTAELARGSSIRGVVLAADWRRYLDQEQWAGPAFEGELRRTVAELQARGLKVLIVAPSPQLPARAPNCLYRVAERQCGVSRADAERDRAAALALLRDIADDHANVRIWDPLPPLCDAEACPAKRETVLYTDHHHLTATAARSLAPSAAPYLSWAAR